MNKLFIILFCLFLFTACTEEVKQEEIFTVNEQQQNIYKSAINEDLQNLMWNYNEDSYTYQKGNVETNASSRYDSIYKASIDSGIDMKKYESQECVIVSVKLLHFNNDDAGQAYFYFIGNNIVCKYYVYNNKVYSLNDKYVFNKDIEINHIENTNQDISYEKINISTPLSHYDAIDKTNGNIAVIEDEILNIYKYNNNDIKISKKISFKDEGFSVMDASFSDDGKCIVLLGKRDEAQSNENEIIEDEVTSFFMNIIKSSKIVFLDKNLNKTNDSIILDSTDYTSIVYSDKSIMASRGKSIDIFKYINGNWIKDSQMMIKNQVNKMIASDINNDGKNEFITIDGMDIYIYELNDTLDLLWNTHLSIRSIEDFIYSNDLNQDGVKELYITDLSGNTSKYILTETGFKTAGINIEGNESFITGDFNNDGKDDYISKDNSGSYNLLYLAK